jgi:hypothetical protein
MILSDLQTGARLERARQKAFTTAASIQDIRAAVDAEHERLRPQIEARERAQNGLRTALQNADRVLILLAANDIFEHHPSREEMDLLADAISVYLNAKGVVGVKTIVDTLVGKSRNQKKLAEFGKYQGRAKPSELQALAECVDYALIWVRQPVGESFGPDHTFQRSQVNEERKAAILAEARAACDLAGPKVPTPPPKGDRRCSLFRG